MESSLSDHVYFSMLDDGSRGTGSLLIKPIDAQINFSIFSSLNGFMNEDWLKALEDD